MNAGKGIVRLDPKNRYDEVFKNASDPNGRPVNVPLLRRVGFNKKERSTMLSLRFVDKAMLQMTKCLPSCLQRRSPDRSIGVESRTNGVESSPEFQIMQ